MKLTNPCVTERLGYQLGYQFFGWYQFLGKTRNFFLRFHLDLPVVQNTRIEFKSYRH